MFINLWPRINVLLEKRYMEHIVDNNIEIYIHVYKNNVFYVYYILLYKCIPR